MKLFQNKTTGQFGVTLMYLKSLYPNISFPKNLKEYGDWVSYETTSIPRKEYHIAVELAPKDGVQQWQLQLSGNMNQIVKMIHTEIDDKVSLVTAPFERFRAQYDNREKEALVFKENRYEGEPGPLLKNFASSFGIDYRMATDRVLYQSHVLRKLDTDLENLRMRKYEIKLELDIDTIISIKRDIYSKIEEIEVQSKNI